MTITIAIGTSDLGGLKWLIFRRRLLEWSRLSRRVGVAKFND